MLGKEAHGRPPPAESTYGSPFPCARPAPPKLTGAQTQHPSQAAFLVARGSLAPARSLPTPSAAQLPLRATTRASAAAAPSGCPKSLSGRTRQTGLEHIGNRSQTRKQSASSPAAVEGNAVGRTTLRLRRPDGARCPHSSLLQPTPCPAPC